MKTLKLLATLVTSLSLVACIGAAEPDEVTATTSDAVTAPVPSLVPSGIAPRQDAGVWIPPWIPPVRFDAGAQDSPCESSSPTHNDCIATPHCKHPCADDPVACCNSDYDD